MQRQSHIGPAHAVEAQAFSQLQARLQYVERELAKSQHQHGLADGQLIANEQKSNQEINGLRTKLETCSVERDSLKSSFRSLSSTTSPDTQQLLQRVAEAEIEKAQKIAENDELRRAKSRVEADARKTADACNTRLTWAKGQVDSAEEKVKRANTANAPGWMQEQYTRLQQTAAAQASYNNTLTQQLAQANGELERMKDAANGNGREIMEFANTQHETIIKGYKEQIDGLVAELNSRQKDADENKRDYENRIQLVEARAEKAEKELQELKDRPAPEPVIVKVPVAPDTSCLTISKSFECQSIEPIVPTPPARPVLTIAAPSAFQSIEPTLPVLTIAAPSAFQSIEPTLPVLTIAAPSAFQSIEPTLPVLSIEKPSTSQSIESTPPATQILSIAMPPATQSIEPTPSPPATKTLEVPQQQNTPVVEKPIVRPSTRTIVTPAPCSDQISYVLNRLNKKTVLYERHGYYGKSNKYHWNDNLCDDDESNGEREGRKESARKADRVAATTPKETTQEKRLADVLRDLQIREDPHQYKKLLEATNQRDQAIRLRRQAEEKAQEEHRMRVEAEEDIQRLADLAQNISKPSGHASWLKDWFFGGFFASRNPSKHL